jgi:hypothetical protein
VPDAGRVWSALSDAGPQAGLVPVLLGDDPADDEQGPRWVDLPGQASASESLGGSLGIGDPGTWGRSRVNCPV